MANRYSVLLKFLENSNSHSVLKFKGKIKFIAVTYTATVSTMTFTIATLGTMTLTIVTLSSDWQ
jgi:hypothetical protein